MERAIDLRLTTEQDGVVSLCWSTTARVHAYTVLVIRTGARPAFTAIHLSPKVCAYGFSHLSRHQRYRMAIRGDDGGDGLWSPWIDVTPRRGILPQRESAPIGVDAWAAQLERVTVMPQNQRLTVYWRRTVGFVDKVVVDLRRGNALCQQQVLDPEVSSVSFHAERGASLVNGQPYAITTRLQFAGRTIDQAPEIRCVPAGQGKERAANQSLDQSHLIYPFLSLGPELRFFPEDEGDDGAAVATQIVCHHCGAEVQWQQYHLCCTGCGVEFVPNGRGSYLDLLRLRFGVCQCCLPHKILVQPAGSASLQCSHSGKEHIQLPGAEGYRLIEDLPFGLCQCCRPRRPLVRAGQKVICSASEEQHVPHNNTYVLVPSEPVFDATQIDDLLDAGLLEICASGVSRRNKTQKRRRR